MSAKKGLRKPIEVALVVSPSFIALNIKVKGKAIPNIPKYATPNKSRNEGMINSENSKVVIKIKTKEEIK